MINSKYLFHKRHYSSLEESNFYARTVAQTFDSVNENCLSSTLMWCCSSSLRVQILKANILLKIVTFFVALALCLQDRCVIIHFGRSRVRGGRAGCFTYIVI